MKTCLLLITLLCAAFTQAPLSRAAEAPEALLRAREAYEKDVLRYLPPVQETYIKSLRQFQFSLTQAGQLKEAQEAAEEVISAQLWEGFPKKNSSPSSLSAPELVDLRAKYEQAFLRVLEPIQDRYVKELERLISIFSQAGNLDAATEIQAELLRAKDWNTVPGEQTKRKYLSELDKDGFARWLRTKSIHFIGVFRNTLHFNQGDEVTWINQEGTINYHYNITEARTLIIEHKAPLTVKFSQNLESGTLESPLAKKTYELRIEERTVQPET